MAGGAISEVVKQNLVKNNYFKQKNRVFLKRQEITLCLKIMLQKLQISFVK